MCFHGSDRFNGSKVRPLQRISSIDFVIYNKSNLIFFNERNLSKSEMAEKDAAGIGMKIASEAITNIRTVASLSETIMIGFLYF